MGAEIVYDLTDADGNNVGVKMLSGGERAEVSTTIDGQTRVETVDADDPNIQKRMQRASDVIAETTEKIAETTDKIENLHDKVEFDHEEFGGDGSEGREAALKESLENPEDITIKEVKGDDFNDFKAKAEWTVAGQGMAFGAAGACLLGGIKVAESNRRR